MTCLLWHVIKSDPDLTRIFECQLMFHWDCLQYNYENEFPTVYFLIVL